MIVRNCINKDLVTNIHTENIDNDLSNQICLFGLDNWFKLFLYLSNAAVQVIFFVIYVL